MHHPTDRITHTTAFVTPVVEHWLEREIAQWVHPMKDRSDDPSRHGATSRSINDSRSVSQKSNTASPLSVPEGKKERKLLFNDASNTFYLRLYGVRHIVKDNSDSERGNPLPPHWLLFPISSKFFYMHHPIDRIAHTTVFITPVVELWQERGYMASDIW